jgi:hypothetical protein
MEKLALCGLLSTYLELAEAAKSAHWDSAEISLSGFRLYPQR